MSRSAGTGYPVFFDCAKARRIYRHDPGEQARLRSSHVWELTGRTKRTPQNGKGHPRKSPTTFEYSCACGHTGWSSHRTLEDRAQHLGIDVPWPSRPRKSPTP